MFPSIRDVTLKANMDLIDLLGIGESLVAEFCSCVATGSTSTTTVKNTVLSTCLGTSYSTRVSHVTSVQVLTVTTTIPLSATSTQTIQETVTSQVTETETETVMTTTTPPPSIADITTTVGYVTTVDVTETTTIAAGITTITTSAEASIDVTSTKFIATSYTTTPCAQPTQTFALQVASSSYEGEYWTEILGNANTGGYILYPQSDLAAAQGFYLDSGMLYDTSGRVFIESGVQSTIVSFRAPGSVTAVTGCSINNGQLTCTDGSDNSFWISTVGSAYYETNLVFGPMSGDQYYEFPGGNPSSGQTPIIALNVVPLCIL
jgi:hypothetical protein